MAMTMAKNVLSCILVFVILMSVVPVFNMTMNGSTPAN